MPHVLVAGKLHPSGIELLQNTSGFTYDYVEEVSEPSYAPHVAKADALVIRTQPLSASTVAKATRLRIVSRHGVGYDAIHLPSLNARGIALAIVGDVNSVSVAEHAMMLLMGAAKRVNRADKAVRANGWGWRNGLEPTELSGKKLLIIGYGRIGRLLARMAASFSMEIKAFDPFLERAGWPDGSVEPVSDFAAALGWADAVSVHVPKGDSPVIGREDIGAMKRGAIIINTARGGAINEEALADALRTGQIAAAGIDVFGDEPPKPDHPLLAFDQIVLSPHNAALTAECGERMALSSVQNVLAFFNHRIDPALVVNREALNGL